MIKKVHSRFIVPTHSVRYSGVSCQFSALLQILQGGWEVKERGVGGLCLFVYLFIWQVWGFFLKIVNTNASHITICLCLLFSNISKESILNDHWLWKVCSFFFKSHLDLILSEICLYRSSCLLMLSLSIILLYCNDRLLIISVLGFELQIYNEALKYVVWYLGVLIMQIFHQEVKKELLGN